MANPTKSILLKSKAKVELVVKKLNWSKNNVADANNSFRDSMSPGISAYL